MLARRCLLPDSLLLLPELGRKLLAEVLRFEHLPELHLTLPEWRPLQPLDGLLLGSHLPQPEPGNELLCFGKWTIRDRALVPLEPHTSALRARLQSLSRQHDACFRQLLVELA